MGREVFVFGSSSSLLVLAGCARQALQDNTDTAPTLPPGPVGSIIKEGGGYKKMSQQFTAKQCTLPPIGNIGASLQYVSSCGAVDPLKTPMMIQRWHAKVEDGFKAVIAANGGPCLHRPTNYC